MNADLLVWAATVIAAMKIYSALLEHRHDKIDYYTYSPQSKIKVSVVSTGLTL